MITNNAFFSKLLFVILVVFFLNACGGGDEKGFRINFTDPDAGLNNVSIASPIKIRFSEAVKAESLNDKTISLHDMSTHKSVKRSLKFSSDPSEVLLVPVGLEYENHYVLNVHHMVTSMGGTHLEKSYEINFYTEERPHVFSQSPKPGSIDINPRTTISVTFEMPMDNTSINQQSFYLSDMNNNTIAATVQVDETSASLTPLNDLVLNTTYVITLANTIRHADGTQFNSNDVLWSFTTAAQALSTVHIGGDNSDVVTALAVDSQNNLLVAGAELVETKEIRCCTRNADAVVSVYSNNHRKIWDAVLATQEYDTATHITSDPQNNVYVAGYTDGSLDPQKVAALSDIFVAKFSPQGQQLWLKQFGSDAGNDMSHGILYVNNQLYVAGASTGNFEGRVNKGSSDLVLMQLNPETGTPNWTLQEGTTNDEHVFGVGADAQGNIIIGVDALITDAGPTNPTVPPSLMFGPPSIVTIYAFGPNQQIAWQQTMDSTLYVSHPRALAVRDNTIAVTGERFLIFGPDQPPPTSGEPDMGGFVTVFDAANSGAIGLNKIVVPFEPEALTAVAVDVDGSIVAAGFNFMGDFFAPPPPSPGVINPPPMPTMSMPVRKLDANGEDMWFAKIPVVEHAMAETIVIDAIGNIHVGGTTHGSVAGNALRGPQDGFLATLTSATGSLQ